MGMAVRIRGASQSVGAAAQCGPGSQRMGVGVKGWAWGLEDARGGQSVGVGVRV